MKIVIKMKKNYFAKLGMLLNFWPRKKRRLKGKSGYKINFNQALLHTTHTYKISKYIYVYMYIVYIIVHVYVQYIVFSRQGLLSPKAPVKSTVRSNKGKKLLRFIARHEALVWVVEILHVMNGRWLKSTIFSLLQSVRINKYIDLHTEKHVFLKLKCIYFINYFKGW